MYASRVDDRCPGREHVLEKVVAADAEVDTGGVGMQRLQLAEHGPRVWEYEAFVVERAESAGPRIEQLERPCAVAELATDGRH